MGIRNLGRASPSALNARHKVTEAQRHKVKERLSDATIFLNWKSEIRNVFGFPLLPEILSPQV